MKLTPKRVQIDHICAKSGEEKGPGVSDASNSPHYSASLKATTASTVVHEQEVHKNAQHGSVQNVESKQDKAQRVQMERHERIEAVKLQREARKKAKQLEQVNKATEKLKQQYAKQHLQKRQKRNYESSANRSRNPAFNHKEFVSYDTTSTSVLLQALFFDHSSSNDRDRQKTTTQPDMENNCEDDNLIKNENDDERSYLDENKRQIDDTETFQNCNPRTGQSFSITAAHRHDKIMTYRNNARYDDHFNEKDDGMHIRSMNTANCVGGDDANDTSKKENNPYHQQKSSTPKKSSIHTNNAQILIHTNQETEFNRNIWSGQVHCDMRMNNNAENNDWVVKKKRQPTTTSVLTTSSTNFASTSASSPTSLNANESLIPCSIGMLPRMSKAVQQVQLNN
jgi:hypothetical protein